MMRSILIGIDDSASDIAAQELGVRWAERFNARLTAITIVQGHGAESSADLVSASVSHHSADPVRIADNRPMVDAGDWQIEKQFGERCREAGVTFELIGDVASPHVQILLERRITTSFCWASASVSSLVGARARLDGRENHPELPTAGGCCAGGFKRRRVDSRRI